MTMVRRLVPIVLTFGATACETIMDTGNDLGRHLPTIGDSCESVQCFTAEGRARSDAIKAERLRQEAAKANPAPVAATPPPAKNMDGTPVNQPTPYDTVKPF